MFIEVTVELLITKKKQLKNYAIMAVVSTTLISVRWEGCGNMMNSVLSAIKKVCIRAKRPTRPELIPVSVA